LEDDFSGEAHLILSFLLVGQRSEEVRKKILSAVGRCFNVEGHPSIPSQKL
jgi:hypothetical protein